MNTMLMLFFIAVKEIRAYFNSGGWVQKREKFERKWNLLILNAFEYQKRMEFKTEM